MTDLKAFAQEIKKAQPVVSGEDYCFAAAGLDHGHIGGMTGALIQAGAKLLYVYDRDRERAQTMADKYGAKARKTSDYFLHPSSSKG